VNKVVRYRRYVAVAFGAAVFAVIPPASAQEQTGAAKAAFNLDRVDGAQFVLVRLLPLLDAGDVIEITPALADPSRPLGALQIAAEKPRRRDPPKTVLTSASVEPTATSSQVVPGCRRRHCGDPQGAGLLTPFPPPFRCPLVTAGASRRGSRAGGRAVRDESLRSFRSL
jgi:hypothetical protein